MGDERDRELARMMNRNPNREIDHATRRRNAELDRMLDVQKVGAELRAQELENLRFAERLKAGEREDPKVGKRVEIKGATVMSVTEPEGPTEWAGGAFG